jgi:hypothetical protein
VAKWRPNVPVLALFPPTLAADSGVRWAIGGVAACRAELLRRGVIPMLADPRDGLSEDAMLRSALHFAEHAAGLVSAGDVVCVSHKLRSDISISVLHVGDGDPGVLTASGAPPVSSEQLLMQQCVLMVRLNALAMQALWRTWAPRCHARPARRIWRAAGALARVRAAPTPTLLARRRDACAAERGAASPCNARGLRAPEAVVWGGARLRNAKCPSCR